MNLRNLSRTLKRELKTYQLVARDPRTPKSSRFLLSAAIGYTLMPFDLIPDFLPIIGHLDDAIIVPGLVVLALRKVSREVVEQCREQAQLEVEGAQRDAPALLKKPGEELIERS